MNVAFDALKIYAEWITFLLWAVPAKLRPTLLELLLGAMISKNGHITDAYFAIRPMKHWGTYFKTIEKGKFAWINLAKRWIQLLLHLFKIESINLAIDDFLTFRSSKKAPSCAIHHDHAQRANRPTFVQGQLRVGLAAIVSKNGRHRALPLLMHLIRTTGNMSKIRSARLLMNLVLRWFPQLVQTRLLLDAWYMKASFVMPMIEKGITVIGQVRKDTVLCDLPSQKQGRGRPRKYGERITLDKLQEHNTISQATISAYGKDLLFQYYSGVAKARFLKGQLVRFVWCRFLKDDGQWTKWHLLLTTDPHLEPSEVIRLFALRWWVEPMFNELKNLFGMNNAWQQTKQSLARWTMILSLAYSLPQLMALWLGPDQGAKFFSIPWRRQKPVTAGWIAKGISYYFQGFPVRRLWDRKEQKMKVPPELFAQDFKEAA
jgi:hypothetical protein